MKTFKITVISFTPQDSSDVIIGDSCGNMTMIRLMVDGYETIKESMGGHSSYISSIGYDDKWVYTFAMDGKINLWNRQKMSR